MTLGVGGVHEAWPRKKLVLLPEVCRTLDWVTLPLLLRPASKMTTEEGREWPPPRFLPRVMGLGLKPDNTIVPGGGGGGGVGPGFRRTCFQTKKPSPNQLFEVKLRN